MFEGSEKKLSTTIRLLAVPTARSLDFVLAFTRVFTHKEGEERFHLEEWDRRFHVEEWTGDLTWKNGKGDLT